MPYSPLVLACCAQVCSWVSPFPLVTVISKTKLKIFFWNLATWRKTFAVASFSLFAKHSRINASLFMVLSRVCHFSIETVLNSSSSSLIFYIFNCSFPFPFFLDETPDLLFPPFYSHFSPFLFTSFFLYLYIFTILFNLFFLFSVTFLLFFSSLSFIFFQ